MSYIKCSNALLFKFKNFKNKVNLDKSNKYVLDLISNSNITLEDLTKFSSMVTFDKEIIFKKLLELNNVDLIVEYFDFLINSVDNDFINLKNFNKLFEIYIKNTNKDITDFVISNYYYMNLELLTFIFNYYFNKNKLIINEILCNISIFTNLVDYIDIDINKINYIKKYILKLIQDSEYNVAEQILSLLFNKKLLDLNYVKEFEKFLIYKYKSDEDSALMKFIIRYYKKNINNQEFIDRGDYMLDCVIKNSNNDDIYFVVKFLLSRGDIDKAIYVSKFIKMSDKDSDIIYYNKLLRLSIPMAIILEKDKYLYKKLVLNIIKKDKLKLYVYGQEIIDGYDFNDHEKNVFLDNKYIELLKNNNNNQINDDEVEKEFDKLNGLILKINRYNAFFQKSVL